MAGATVALSFKGIVAKLAYAEGLSASWLLLLRFAIAVPLLWWGLRWLDRGPKTPLTGHQWRGCITAGMLFAAAAWCDFHALSYISASVSRVVLFTFPLFVVVLDALGRRAWPAPRHLVAFAVAYSGLWLVLDPARGATWQGDAAWGVALAFGSSLTYAGYLLVSQGTLRRMGSSRFTAVATTVAGVAIAAITGPVAVAEQLTLNAPQLGWALVLAVACTVLPFFLLAEGIRRSDATKASLIALFGPAITVVGAWWLLGERLILPQWLGVAVVALGVALTKEGLVRALGRWWAARLAWPPPRS